MCIGRQELQTMEVLLWSNCFLCRPIAAAESCVTWVSIFLVSRWVTCHVANWCILLAIVPRWQSGHGFMFALPGAFNVLSQLCIHLPRAKEVVVSASEVVLDTRLAVRPTVSYKLPSMGVKIFPVVWSLLIWNEPMLFLLSSDFSRSMAVDGVKMIN